jgi:hypothetical protein
MIPLALLAASTGLALSFVGERRVGIYLLIFFGAALAAIAVGTPPILADRVTIGVGVSAFVAACAVHWPWRPSHALAVALAFNGGLWCGMMRGTLVMPYECVAVVLVLLAIPGRKIVALERPAAQVALKIIAGWIAAVAILTTALPLMLTPGNVMDHKE